MKKIKYYLFISFILISLSVIMFTIHFMMFGQALNTAYYSIMNLCFIPINSLVVTIILEKLIDHRSKKERIEKLNMLIGIFFTEIGGKLMHYIIVSDKNTSDFNFNFEDLKYVRTTLTNHDYNIEIDEIDLNSIKNLLVENNNLLINLISNENLLQNQTFTDLIMSIIHLRDEILFFESNTLEEVSKKHLENDILRVYENIVIQWVFYLEYLKKFYPFLYSNAIRVNPFLFIKKGQY